MIKRVLITGASGFVGRNFSAYIRSNNLPIELVIMGRSALNRETIDPSFFSGIDAVLHCAGKAHDIRNLSQPDEYYQVNLALTRKLYDAFLDSAASQFIFLSSVKAVADKTAGWLDENAEPLPVGPYGMSKRMAEEYIEQQALPENKSYYILRPCMIHGPGNKGNLNSLYGFVRKGLPWPLGAFENQRSFLSIENLCFVFEEIITRNDIDSGIYHVADDKAVSTNELIILISEALGKRSRILKLPAKIIRVIAGIGTSLHLPFNAENLRKLTENYLVSNRKLLNALGKQLPVDAFTGLARTIRSFDGQENLPG